MARTPNKEQLCANLVASKQLRTQFAAGRTGQLGAELRVNLIGRGSHVITLLLTTYRCADGNVNLRIKRHTW